MQCPGCGKQAEELSPTFRSVRHEHPSSTGVMKSLFLECEVNDGKTGELVSVCHKCKIDLSLGMTHGGNFERHQFKKMMVDGKQIEVFKVRYVKKGEVMVEIYPGSVQKYMKLEGIEFLPATPEEFLDNYKKKYGEPVKV